MCNDEQEDILCNINHMITELHIIDMYFRYRIITIGITCIFRQLEHIQKLCIISTGQALCVRVRRYISLFACKHFNLNHTKQL